MEWTDQLRSVDWRVCQVKGSPIWRRLKKCSLALRRTTPPSRPLYCNLASCVPVADLPSQPDVREEEVVHDASGARQLGQHVGGAHIELPDARVRLVREHVDGDGNLAEQHDGGEDKDEEEDAVGAVAQAEVSARLAG